MVWLAPHSSKSGGRRVNCHDTWYRDSLSRQSITGDGRESFEGKWGILPGNTLRQLSLFKRTKTVIRLKSSSNYGFYFNKLSIFGDVSCSFVNNYFLLRCLFCISFNAFFDVLRIISCINVLHFSVILFLL